MRNRLVSIEHAPLIRKFTVLFIVMSFLPFIVIAYFFVLSRTSGGINIPENALFLILLLVGAGTLAGFYGMRRSILKISEIIQRTQDTLTKEAPTLSNYKVSEESEITQLTHTFNTITQNLENNIRRLEESRRTMQYVLSKLAIAISSLHNIDNFLELIVEITTNALEAKTGILMLLDEEKQELYIKSASGLNKNFKNLRLVVGDEGPGWVAKHKKALFIPALNKAVAPTEENPFIPPLLCSPMLFQDKLIGVLVVAGRLSGGSFEEDELLIISNLASQTAIAVENERLNQDAEKTYLETVSALAMAVEARDPYNRGHSDRVSRYSVKIAHKLGLEPDLIKDIKDAAELHDVGKIGISDAILKKPTALNEEEMQVMRNHPIIGEGIVKPVRSLSRLCSIIRHHHEFMDGSGYPDGLKADQVPLGSKILLVADSFDAITTDRPYCKALSFETAKEELKKYIDIRYDGKIVEAFISVI